MQLRESSIYIETNYLFLINQSKLKNHLNLFISLLDDVNHQV
jgi:hypothetical protein